MAARNPFPAPPTLSHPEKQRLKDNGGTSTAQNLIALFRTHCTTGLNKKRKFIFRNLLWHSDFYVLTMVDASAVNSFRTTLAPPIHTASAEEFSGIPEGPSG
jgi:hypothetical protein